MSQLLCSTPRVDNSRQRHRGKAIPHPLKYLLYGGMVSGIKDCLGNGQPLWGNPHRPLPQSLYKLKLC